MIILGIFTVLVIEDESRMRKLIRDFLAVKEFNIIEACDGEEGIEKFMSVKGIDLVLLDIMLPKLDGWEVCRQIRKISNVPIIMITAKGAEHDELLGFELGVDEYITKPFSPKILVARIEALLRRTNNKKLQIKNLGGLVFDKAGHVVFVDGVPIELSNKEFELLAYFIENEGVVLSRDKILNHVWNYDYYGDARTVDTHVKKLRSKLLSKGSYIKTVWGSGYKFEVV